MLLLAIFTLGVALLVSTMAIYFVDIVDLYAILLQAWFYLTPILYPIEILSPRAASILRWNPMNIILTQFRNLMYYGELPGLRSILGVTVLAVGTLTVGWLVFTKRIDELAYRI
jgi:ABC-type polysaccharide/polyol phosphate export permease